MRCDQRIKNTACVVEIDLYGSKLFWAACAEIKSFPKCKEILMFSAFAGVIFIDKMFL